MTLKEILQIRNVRNYLVFRSSYFARFYYPVFTLLYLDYGLTLSQFAILNVIWAATIVISEVPSGAFADTLGRKKLVVLSSVVMFIEIAMIALVPTGNPTLVFVVFMINRVLSGLAMSLASGADEALAYDTLKAQGKEEVWPQVLQTQLRLSSGIGIFVTLLGAAMYDVNFMASVYQFLGFAPPENTQDIMRIPVFATLFVAIIAIYAAINMEEDNHALPTHSSKWETTVASFKLTLDTGKWVIATPYVLFILLYYSLFEHISRMFLTMNSQYYRAIDIPIIYFGFIGAGISMLQILLAGQSRRLAEIMAPRTFLLVMGIATAITYYLISLGWSIYGVIPVLVLIFINMTMNIFISYHLNKKTESHNRATVLSFKGLMFNLGYGSIGILYAYYYKLVSLSYTEREIEQHLDFLASLSSFSYYFAFWFVVISGWFYVKSRRVGIF
ncbi:putative Permease of the major facilitator superfamily [Vibrio nigripulchritudo SFn27]|uniref:Putative Permease of the major facilitator superfamily n=1 Tax=Vibrio nigripulchritudo TaxID=28173 RepID=U4KEG4_9VIBR|nr:MFS transporter [Vibrio nigripulchritudo]CCN81359.1 putative Permease of the major facilitator superfamily [Vibrio nigripulchritudo BLFn1]CCN91214.1 putative Permease of the major facilitator superfamily [Vibrio nigripulchritudo SFn27]CCN96313.1 putative Permease of the major facilitator superfamily [Vibrio nigripulchritudo ENn2]CCO38529.1 putative Permease of the major facilitator superfamily [Vibrio nigripulchritudo SFn135]CCO50442.1 putative Permease of the major facilitator superfamily 